jgi:predicted transcriptional regulator
MEMNSNVEHSGQARVAGPRHSILDLAPLELECLSVLWPMGEGTVRDIHRALVVSRPRAYTTVMTIMDRLEQKGIVARRKVGRAFRYQARLSAEEARLKAVEKIVEGFFAGSPEALAAHLSTMASTASMPSLASLGTQGSVVREIVPRAAAVVDAPAAPVAELQTQNLDERLL